MYIFILYVTYVLLYCYYIFNILNIILYYIICSNMREDKKKANSHRRPVSSLDRLTSMGAKLI